MTNNQPQLPVEVVEEIKLCAKAFAAGMWPSDDKHSIKQREYVANIHEACATAYATKLHELQKENKILNSHRAFDKNYIEALIEKKKKANALLEGVLNHVEGEIYNEIESFLYGE